MEELLSKMDPEKRVALINAALIEFGNNNYQKASTNVIVKNAGISKGLLYHYFKNKMELYEYLKKFLFEKYTLDIIQHIDYSKSDILERIALIAKYKMSTFEVYPGIIVFSKSFYTGKGIEELKKMIDEYVPGYYQKVFQENVDYSLFKEGIDIQRAMKMTQWILEKLSEEKVMAWENTGAFDINEFYDELLVYLDMMKDMFYK